ncbi:MAG TPA: hypothetical protein VGM78_01515 [Ilumatobacteraceae bacterium]
MDRREAALTRHRRDVGETLIEIVLTVVIIGISITALISALATAGSAGTTQRISVESDTVMRNYAEATKAAARTCVVGGTYSVDFSAPTGYVVGGGPVAATCPDVTSTQLLSLSVTGPTGVTAHMDMRVRSP